LSTADFSPLPLAWISLAGVTAGRTGVLRAVSLPTADSSTLPLTLPLVPLARRIAGRAGILGAIVLTATLHCVGDRPGIQIRTQSLDGLSQAEPLHHHLLFQIRERNPEVFRDVQSRIVLSVVSESRIKFRRTLRLIGWRRIAPSTSIG